MRIKEMKNNRRKVLPAAILLLFIVSQVSAVTAAQTTPPAPATSGSEQKKTAPPEKPNTSAEKIEKQAGEKKEEPGKKEEGAKPKNQKQRNQEQKNQEPKGRGNTYNAPPGSTSDNPVTYPVSTSEDSNKDVQGLNDREATLEKQSPLTESSLLDWIPEWLRLILAGLLGLAVVAGIVFGYGILRKNKEKERAEIAGNFSALKKHHKAVVERIIQLEDVSKNLSQQIAQQKAEISSLKQVSRTASYVTPEPVSTYRQPVEEPQFPVMVDDYLARVKNRAIPVKYDYKEKMLVEDGENEGHLLVVSDDSEQDALYLVPSFGFFQKKSDYTTYFENYYNCARPISGSVCIRLPAMVIRVNGGWQLEQLGELEVR
jgi:hypothetical protein